MLLDRKIARQTADLLLQINAIKLNLNHPFVWASGLKSPIYCNNRLVLSHISIRTKIVSWLCDAIENKITSKPYSIAGIATGAIGIASLVAMQLNCPYFNLHSQPFSLRRKQEKTQLIVIEDLVSTGKSSLGALEHIDLKTYTVAGLFCLFTYGFESTDEKFKKHNIDFYSLCDYSHLLKQVKHQGGFDESDLESLGLWHKDPHKWSVYFDKRTNR